jgi:hypothetical protein
MPYAKRKGSEQKQNYPAWCLHCCHVSKPHAASVHASSVQRDILYELICRKNTRCIYYNILHANGCLHYPQTSASNGNGFWHGTLRSSECTHVAYKLPLAITVCHLQESASLIAQYEAELGTCDEQVTYIMCRVRLYLRICYIRPRSCVMHKVDKSMIRQSCLCGTSRQ